MNPFATLALTALIPLIVGSVWYSPLLFAKPWMAAVGMTPEQQRQGNMALNMLGLYILSFLVAIGLTFVVVHQYHIFSTLANEPGMKEHTSPTYDMYNNLMQTYGHRFRTYKHGALHAGLAGVFVALPLIASGAIFEKRGIKYVAITWGFWLINFILMGAVLCHWMPVTLG